MFSLRLESQSCPSALASFGRCPDILHSPRHRLEIFDLDTVRRIVLDQMTGKVGIFDDLNLSRQNAKLFVEQRGNRV